MANGGTARGALVSSARSAAPSQPMKQYSGSSAAKMKPYHRAPPEVRWVDTRMWKPASWWKKKMAPKNSSAAAPTDPVISKNTPVLLTALTARMLMMLISPAATMASVASSTMSPWVGVVQMSLANTVASATAVAAVPAMKASSAV